MRLSKKSIFALLAVCLLLTGIAAAVLFFSSQTPQERFGIYLSQSNQLVISDKDIVCYNQSSHEMTLTEEGIGKLDALTVPVRGTPFVVRLNGKEVYNGSFWTPISSISCDGIVVEVFRDHNAIVKIQRGYPSSDFASPGADPRNSPEIMGYFQKIGKLTQ
jgi:hypothetical protein